jgi:hypothetical protein
MKTHLREKEPLKIVFVEYWFTACGLQLAGQSKQPQWTRDVREITCKTCLKSKEAGRQAVEYLTKLNM